MKLAELKSIAAMTLFAALAIPVQLDAQNSQDHNKHHHYQVIDMGTFGGPTSFVGLSFNSFPDLNDRGVTVGSSATSVPTSPTSDFILCGGSTGTIPNVFHAFEWQDGNVTDLGALGTEANNCSEAGSVNASGQVSGTSEVDDLDPVLGVKELRAVLWKQGEIVNLGTLGGTLSFALGAINDRGQVVGSATNAIPDPFSLIYLLAGNSNGTQARAFLWQKGVMQDIGTLGGPDAVAIYVNEHSQVAGDSYTNFTPNPVTGLPPLDPFLWEKEKGMIDIGTLGGAWGYPAGVNNRGQVVGYSSLAADPGACTAGGGSAKCDVFLWDRGTLTDLTTTTNGGSPSFVFGINDAEEIVGAATFPNAPMDAYIWRNGVAADLGRLSDCYSLAFGINSHSQVVGGTFDCIDASHSRAFLWENGAMVDLDDLVLPDSPLQLVEAAAINDRGEIAGNGAPPGVARKDIGTLGHAFLLIPCDENHPGVDGCDYSLVDAHAAAPQTSPAVRDTRNPTLPRLRPTGPYHFPVRAFGPED